MDRFTYSRPLCDTDDLDSTYKNFDDIDSGDDITDVVLKINDCERRRYEKKAENKRSSSELWDGGEGYCTYFRFEDIDSFTQCTSELTDLFCQINDIKRFKNKPFKTNILESGSTLAETQRTRKCLHDMCAAYGRKSQKVQELCKLICDRFLQISGITGVYPTYKVGNETNIVFVLTVKSNSIDCQQHLNDFEVETVIKTVTTEICEDDFVTAYEWKDKDNEMERLKHCILCNAEDLMQKHKYLNIIRGGLHKPKNSAKTEPCLVLYVHAKGFIPIDEEPLEKAYDGIHVEVREGRFVPFTNHADVVLEKVRMGCKIEGHQPGTLGVFIEHPSYGICGITCAHVVLSADGMEECKSENGRLLSEKILSANKYIHQPNKTNDNVNRFGQIVEVVYKEGKKSETGIEIALIQIDKRHPDSGKFPTPRSPSGPKEPGYEFASGKTCGPTRFNVNNCCFKVGSVTDFTEGTIELQAPNVVRTDKHMWDYDTLRVTLYNQILVRPIRAPFADFGDSGSPVFVKDEETGEHACIGLVEGGLTAGGLVVVTPITKILEEFGSSQLKVFPINLANVMHEIQQLKCNLERLESQFELLLNHLKKGE